MTVNVRWVTVAGTQKISVTGLQGTGLTLTESTAWQLVHELETALLTKPPAPPDNGG